MVPILFILMLENSQSVKTLQSGSIQLQVQTRLQLHRQFQQMVIFQLLVLRTEMSDYTIEQVILHYGLIHPSEVK